MTIASERAPARVTGTATTNLEAFAVSFEVSLIERSLNALAHRVKNHCAVRQYPTRQNAQLTLTAERSFSTPKKDHSPRTKRSNPQR